MRRWQCSVLAATSLICILFASSLAGWRWWPSGKEVILLDSGTYVSGQLASVTLPVDLGGHTIVAFQASCGCLGLESSAGPITLPALVDPKQSYFLKMDTTGRTGQHLFHAVLKLEKDGKSKWRQFQCRLDIRPAWIVLPDALVAREVHTPASQEFFLAVYQQRAVWGMPVARVEVSDPGRMQATVMPVVGERGDQMLPADKSFHLTYEVLLRCAPPNITSYDWLTIVGADERVRTRVPILWKIEPQVSYQPQAMIVSGDSGDVVTRSIWIEHRVEDSVSLAGDWEPWARAFPVAEIGPGLRRTEIRLHVRPGGSGQPRSVSFRCGGQEYDVPILYIKPSE